jgi:hypothetical protein
MIYHSVGYQQSRLVYVCSKVYHQACAGTLYHVYTVTEIIWWCISQCVPVVTWCMTIYTYEPNYRQKFPPYLPAPLLVANVKYIFSLRYFYCIIIACISKSLQDLSCLSHVYLCVFLASTGHIAGKVLYLILSLVAFFNLI